MRSKVNYLAPSDIVKVLTCPKCFTTPNSSLIYKSGFYYCKRCKQKYPIKNKIIELINPTTISPQVMAELKGNDIVLTKKNIEHYAKKDHWSKYYNHVVKQKMDFLIEDLKKINTESIVSLGSGPGFEIKEVLKRKKYKTIYSSDLAFTATSIVPYTLKNYKTNLCLFTSDLNFTPVMPSESYPILIYEALHHTKSSVKTIELMMKKKYHDILFVEPCTNFLIKILAKIGLAQRVEYSGVHPDFVDLEDVKRLAYKYKYKAQVDTIWDIPEAYVRVLGKKGSLTESIIVKLTDIASVIGNVFDFGSFAVVHLHRLA